MTITDCKSVNLEEDNTYCKDKNMTIMSIQLF